MKGKVEIVDSLWFEYATIIGLLTLVYVGCFAALGSFASSANANVDYANQYETLQQTIIDEYNHRLNVSQNTGESVDVQEFENSNARLILETMLRATADSLIINLLTNLVNF